MLGPKRDGVFGFSFRFAEMMTGARKRVNPPQSLEPQVLCQLLDLVSHGHWEGDLIKGKAKGSAAGTLVGRTRGYLMLVKMSDIAVLIR